MIQKEAEKPWKDMLRDYRIQHVTLHIHFTKSNEITIKRIL